MLPYVVLATCTDQGVKNANDSSKRAEAFKQMAKTFGVTVKDMSVTPPFSQANVQEPFSLL